MTLPRFHALGDSAFAALAAGRPSAHTVDELRRAAYGRHVLLQALLHGSAPPPSDPLWGAAAAAALREGRPLPSAAGPSGHQLMSTHQDQTIAVRLEDTDPRRRRLGLTPARPLPGSGVEHWQACLDSAWRLLVARHPAAAGTLAAVLRVIVPVVADRDARGISATSADAFGAVAMSVPADGVELAVGLLHETQHSLLNAVQRLFPLHADPRAFGYSPWRDDPRPATGILHGAYAYLAVARFWRTELLALEKLPEENLDVETSAGERRPAAAGERRPSAAGLAERQASAAFEFARWRSAVADTADKLLAGGLTAAGRRFAGALRDEAEPWLSEPVATDVARLAGAANADHELRWRLRNHAADPEWVAAAAAARRAGRPPPGPPPPLRLIPAPRRALENSARLELTRDFLAAGGGGDHTLKPGSRATAGDVAFVRGDVVTAADAYLTDLKEADDDTAWTGFALATGDRALRTHLEIVAALHRELREDPLALARWVSLK